MMPSPIPATAYSTPPVPQPTAFRPPARDRFAQGASGQDMEVLGAVPTAASQVSSENSTTEAKDSRPLFGKDGFTFGDLLDIINPLQHIPVVSTVYRAITGDKIDAGARIIGGGLFGGPIGLAVSMVSGMVEETTGKDPGEHALAALGINIGPGNQDVLATALADATQPPNGMTQGELAGLQAQGAQLQAAQAQGVTGALPAQDLKLGVTADDGRGRKLADNAAGQSAPRPNGPVELPADLFQALKQTAATQQANAQSTAANTATANQVLLQQPSQSRNAGPMQTNTAAANSNAGPMPDNAIRTADGRTWFPAFPTVGSGAPAPSRAVGTSPVTQQNGASKFGITRGASYAASPQAATAATAAQIQQSSDPQAEWANRASEAYQKYFEMQDQKNRRAGIVQ